MEGLRITKGQNMLADGQPDCALLAGRTDVEIMTQVIKKGAIAWLQPADEREAFEFYYLLSGTLETLCPNGTMMTLNAGDSIALENLDSIVMLRCVEDAAVLYVTNRPSYASINCRHETLTEQLWRIKDHYTIRHSEAVMRYAMDLYMELCPGLDQKSMEDFLLGALFHDIGKCHIPEDILNKPTRLSDEEFALIKKHAADGPTILEPIFGKKVAELAGLHHERMNGSGYPSGMQGENIPLEARILMVADSFDAMTTDRVYKKAKDVEEAALELYNMKAEYDPAVTEVLLRLVREGRYDKLKIRN